MVAKQNPATYQSFLRYFTCFLASCFFSFSAFRIIPICNLPEKKVKSCVFYSKVILKSSWIYPIKLFQSHFWGLYRTLRPVRKSGEYSKSWLSGNLTFFFPDARLLAVLKIEENSNKNSKKNCWIFIIIIIFLKTWS